MKHSEIIELLPWYANATLKEDERKVVEAHLAGCRECALELESLTLMRQAVVESGGKVSTPSPALLNLALARIEDYERTRPKSDDRRSEPSGNFWNRLAVWWRPTPVFARALIAVQLVLVLALGGVVLQQHRSRNVYTTLTGPTSQQTKLAVAFNQDASEQEIRRAIQEIHGTIVDGPSALGLYTIEVPVPREQTPEIEKLLQRLRQNHRVIRIAEQKL
jgi:anti-sigma factor RsiW